MRIPKREDFALLLMSELATASGQKSIALSEIAKRHGVSQLFLKNIARDLRVAGLVTSKEGAGGGYTLARSPGSICVWEIMQAVAQTGHDVTKQAVGETVCPLLSTCLPQTIHKVLYTALEQSFRTITLTTLSRATL